MSAATLDSVAKQVAEISVHILGTNPTIALSNQVAALSNQVTGLSNQLVSLNSQMNAQSNQLKALLALCNNIVQSLAAQMNAIAAAIGH
jgi:capsule polysaccharide export protein KpsE/RkpR